MSKEGGGFQPGDYRRNSGRLEAAALASEERRRNELLDFIRSNLDTHIYNSYKSSLEKGDFFRAFRTIDEKVIPAISDSGRFTKQQITKARDDLLHPIMLAAENGNQIARSALNARTLPPTQYINPLEYKGRTQDRLMENRVLLEEIDQSIQEKDNRRFEQKRAILVNLVLEGKEPGKTQFEFMKNMEKLSNRLSIMVRAQGVAAPAPIEGNDPRMVIDLASEGSITDLVSEASITDLVLENEARQLIHPEKYQPTLQAALNLHHNLVGQLNLAIADNDVEGIKTSAKVLNAKLKEGLTGEERQPLKEDVGLIFKNITEKIPETAHARAGDRIPEAVAAQARAAVVSIPSNSSVSSDNEGTEQDSPRVKRQRTNNGRC